MGFFPMPTLSSCEWLSDALSHRIPPLSCSSALHYTQIWGNCGEQMASHSGRRRGSTHLLGSCSHPQELPCPHQYEDGFPEKEGCNSSDVSQQRELLSPLELGFGEGLSFPHQCKTGCSPSQHGERWQQDLGHLAKCTHSSPSRC